MRFINRDDPGPAGSRTDISPDLPLYYEAIERCRIIADRNLEWLGPLFPGPVSRSGRYSLNRVPIPGKEGVWAETGANEGWTTGFWSGILWLLSEYSLIGRYGGILSAHLASFRERAQSRADCGHHDMGFLYTLSCVAGYKVLGEQAYRAAALLGADLLMERYLPAAGIFQAWGGPEDKQERGRMIIDSLMNLPLLYWAGETTGKSSYRERAYRHALAALKHLVREDGTTYHTYFFDPDHGNPLYGKTKQGHSDDSCWARGQAWGIYGFALSYSYTKDPDFLEAACRLADHFLSRSPSDHVVYWDLDFGDGSGEEKDSSAAAIAVCGLCEIARQTDDPSRKRHYGSAAHRILQSLCRSYASRPEDGTDGFLLHGVYYKAGGEGVDEASLWGDYFYLEALIRSVTDWKTYW